MQISMPVFSRLFKWSLAIASFLLIQNSNAATYYWVGGPTANWNSATSWNTQLNGLGTAAVPAATDDVIFDGSNIMGVAPITGSVTVTFPNVTTTQIRTVTITGFGANTVTFQANAGAASTLTIMSTSTLVAANNILILSGNGTRTMTVQTSAGVALTVDGTIRTLAPGTGIGSLVVAGAGASLSFSSTGVYENRKDDGTIPLATWAAGSQFIWNVAGQTASRTLSNVLVGPAVTITTSNSQNMALAGANTFASLAIASTGAVNTNTATLIVSGTTTVNGSLVDGSNTGSNTFTGLVTIANGGVFNTTSTSGNTFSGGITNNTGGAFTSVGTMTFSGAQTVDGAGTYTFTGATVIVGVVAYNVTAPIFPNAITVNSGSFTANSSATFRGTLTNNSTTAFAVTGTSTFSPTAGISIAGTGVYTLTGDVTFASNTTTGAGTATVNLGANLIINTGATYNVATSVLAVAGTTSVSGTLSDNSGTGTNTFTGAVTVATGGSVTALSSASTFSSTVTNNGTFGVTGNSSYAGLFTNTGTVNSATGIATYQAGITNSGTFTPTGTSAFSGNQTVDGTSTYTYTFGGPVTIAGTVAFNAVCTFNAVTVSSGSFTANANTTFKGTLTNNSATAFTVTGTSTFSPTAGISIAGTGVYTLTGDVTFASNTTTGAGTATVNLGANLIINTGATYNVATSVLAVAGTTSVSGTLSDNSGTGTNTFTGAVTVASGASITSLSSASTFSSTVTNNGTFGVSGTATIVGLFTNNTGATVNSAGASSYQNNIVNNGTFTPSGASLFTGTTQTISGSNPYGFAAVTVANTSLTFNTPLAVNLSGALLINSGATLEVGQAIITITGATTVTGTWNDNDNAGSNIFVGAVTVAATGNVAQTSTSPNEFRGGIVQNNTTAGSFALVGPTSFTTNTQTLTGTGPLTFGNVSVAMGSARTLTGNISNTLTVSGTLDVNAASIFNISQLTLSVTGATTVAGTMNDANTTGTNSFADVTISGVWSLANPSPVNISGNLVYNGTTFAAGTGIYTFTGASKTISGSLIGISNLVVTGSLSIPVSGSFAVGTGTINPGATFEINAGSTLSVTTTIANNGIFKVVGIPGNPATVTTASASFTITQAGALAIFHAKEYVFNKLGTNGITISAGAIDAINNFSNGSFTNGVGTSSLNLNSLSISPDIIASNVTFEAGPTFNVVRTSGTGTITFSDAKGALSGYFYESDDASAATGLVRWTNSITSGTYYWVGGTTANNWDANGVWATTLGGTGVGSFTPGPGFTYVFDGNNIGAGATGSITAVVNNNYVVGSVKIQNFSGANQVTFQAPTGSNRILTVSPTASDVVTIPAGNTLNIVGNASGNRTLGVVIGTNSTATIDGTVSINVAGTGIGNLSQSGTGAITFGATGLYIHAVNGGAFPTATWSVGSEARVTGATSAVPTGVGQTFSNFTWNATVQSATLSLAAATSINTTEIFKVSSTNNQILQLRNTAGANSFGTYQQEAGTVQFNYGNVATTANIGTLNLNGGTLTANTGNSTTGITVTGNLAQGSGTTLNLITGAGTTNLTVTGTITQTSAALDLAATGATGTGNVFLAGDLTQTGTSTLKKTVVAATGTLSFNGSATQNLTTVAAGFGANAFVFNVNKTGSLLLGAATTLPSTSTLNLTAGVLDLSGRALTLGNGATVNRSGGSFATNGGTYSYNASGTVNIGYSGASDITTGPEIPTLSTGLGTLTVNMSAAASKVLLSANASPSGAVTVTQGTLDLQSFTLNSSAGSPAFTLTANASLLIGGTNTLPSVYAYSFNAASTVNYYGAAQTVAGVTYGHLIVSGTSTKTLGGVASVVGNTSVNSPGVTFDLGANTVNRSTGGGTFLVVSGAFLKIGGTSPFPTNYTTATLTGSTVEYYGTANTVSAVPYHNLIVSGTATNAGTAVAVAGNATVTASGAYSLGTGSVTHTIAGALVNNGAITYGASGNQVLAVTGNLSGNGSLNMSGAAGTKTLNLTGADNSGFVGAFTPASGTVSYNAAGNQILFAGAYNALSFANSGNRTLSGLTSVTQNFTVPANIILGLNGFALNSAGTTTVSASGTLNVIASSALTSTGVLTVGGTLNVSGASSVLTSTSTTVINAGGTLNIGANAVFNINGASITNNGVFMVVGTAGNVATVTSTGNYIINQTGGGAAAAVFHAKYYVFNKLTTNGITISNGLAAGPIDAVNNFSNGTFSNGAGAAYLTLSALNFTSFTANSVVFGSTATNPTKNVVRTSGTGTISFVDYSGAIGGQAFETDNGIPGTLITWSISGTTFYSQASAGFYNLSTWNSAPNGSGSQPATLSKLTDGSSNFIVQATHIVTVDNDISVKDISVAANGNLIIGNSTAVRTILVGGNVNVAAAGTVSVGNFVATHQIYFQSPTASPASTLVNNGTFNLYLASNKKANVYFNGVDMVVSGANSPTFAGVNFNNQVPPFTSNKTTAAVPFIIKGDVQFYNNGLFVDGGLTHKVAGDWAQASANQMTATGTISFNGTTPQAINSVSTFNNLTFEGGNAPQIAGIITVNGKLYITNTTAVATGNLAHVFNGDFEIDNGSSYNQSNGTATFSGTSAQNIDFKNATFYGVQFSNPGIKSTINNLVALNGVGINPGAIVNGPGSHTLTGDLRIDGTCNWSGQVTMLGGNLRSNNATATLPAQLNISGTVSLVNVTAANPLTLNLGGNLNVNSGTFIMTVNALLASTDTASTLSVANGAIIRLLGANNFPSNFKHVVFATGSNARYLGTLPSQIVAGNIAYYHLNVENNNKEVNGPIAVNGNLDFGSVANTVLDLKKFKHSIAGNVSNATTAGIAITSTGAGAGSFTFNNPNANQTIGAIPSLAVDTLAFTLDAPTASRTKTINSGAGIFVNSLVTTNTGGTFINRLILDITSNVINTNGAASSISIGKNTSLYTSGATSLATVFNNTNFATLSFNDSSSVRYTGTAQTIASRTGVSYGSLELAGSGAKTATQAVDVNANMLVVGGSTPVFVDGGFTHTVGGNWTVPVANYSATTSPVSSGTIVLDGLNQNIIGGFVNLVAANGGTKMLTTGAVTIDGNLTVNSGVVMDANTQNVVIRGNWSQLGTGVFTQTTGTTTFNGLTASAQTITIATPATSAFGNLTITRGSGSTPSANTQVITNSSVHIAGRLDLSYYINNPTCTSTIGFASLDISGDSIFIGADFVVRPSTTVLGVGSTIVMDGNNAQVFYLANNATTTFNNILFTGNGTKTFADGNICGAFNWASSFVFTGDFAIDLSTLDARARPITVSGNWINTGDFQHSGTVTLKGANKTISNSTFYSLDINSGGVGGRRRLNGDITVNLDLNIRASDTLDVSASNYAINVVRNWTNAGAFYARQGTVNITSGGMTLNSGGVSQFKSFYNLNITNVACGNTTTLADSLNVNNDLTINTGVLTTGAFNVKVGKNFYNYDQYNQSGGASRLVFTNVFAGTRAFVCTTATAACGTSTYRKINVEVGATSKVVQSGDVLINDAALTVLSGTYKLNGNQVDFSNGANSLVTIASGATLDVDSGASLLVRNTITNFGTFRLVGTVSSPAMLGSCTGCGNGNGYTFVQTAGTIKAKYYAVESKFTSNVANTLLDIQGGTIDVADNLSYGTFSNTTYTCTNACTTSAYVRIAPAVLTSNYTLKGVVFNSGKPRNVNVSSALYAGGNTISFQIATGSSAGAAFELDNPSGGATTGWIRWDYVGAKFWDGNGSTASTSWNTDANWFPDGVPVASDTVFLDNSYLAGTYAVNIDVADTARVARLIMQRTGASTVTLNVLAKSFKVGGSLNISPGCTLNGNTGNIYVGGSWSSSGSFVAGSSKVFMRGLGSTYSVATGGSAFNDITFAGTLNSQYTLSSPLIVTNNVAINSGNTLDVSSLANNVTVGGNWLNNGTFNPRNGTAATITFNKAGNQTISGGPFNLFVTAGTGTKQLLTNVIINRDVTIGVGTVLDAQDMNIYVGRNWINNATAGFSQILGSTVYFNGANQSIDNGTTATSFKNVTLLGTGTKTLFKNSGIDGDFLISPAGLVFNMQDNQLLGNGTTSQFTISSNSRVDVGGSGLFLNNFADVSLAVNSTIRYIPTSAAYDANQTILSLPNSKSYGNIDLRTRTSPSVTPANKNLIGNVVIDGTLTIGDVTTQLNVAGYTISLDGNLSFPTGGLQINWPNGSTGTLVHTGTATYNWQNSWNMDADLVTFNNLVLSGSQRKNLNSDINVFGDLTIQGNVIFDMNAYRVIGTAAKSVLMQSASRLESAMAAPTPAFPTTFGTYNLNPGSTTILDADNDQTVATSAVYGNLIFNNTNTSTPLRVMTLGTNNLVVASDLSLTNTTFNDNGKNVTIAGDFNTNDYYIPSTASRLTLNGDAQVVRNALNAPTVININKLTVAGTGIKTIGNGAVTVNISDSLFVDTSLVLNTTRPLVFSGRAWYNYGSMALTNSTTFRNKTGKVMVYAGASDPANYFSAVTFNTLDTVAFVWNGADFNGSFDIDSGVVNMGSGLNHTMAGAITIAGSPSSAQWITKNANLIFDGGTQSIPVALTARNVTLANAGTKTMNYRWTVADLTINTGVTFSNAAVDTLFVSGNWLNNGTFNAANSTVLLNATSGNKTIYGGASNFYDLSIAPLTASTYKLTSPSTRVAHALDVRNTGKLKLNSNTLIHGINSATLGKNLYVGPSATLEIDTSGFLLFDNRNLAAVATIDGTLNILGSSVNVATISRSNAGGHSVIVNGTLAANNYLMEYASSTGLTLGSGATLHSTYNLSNGTFSFLNAAAGSTYITSALNASPTNITNVIFNYVGTPSANTHNIVHTGSGTVTFDSPIAGALACPAYSIPANGALNVNGGKVVMPNCTIATWIGVLDDDWSKGGNWSTGVIPDSQTDVFIPRPGAPYQANLPVVSVTNATARNITIVNGSLSLDPGSTLDATGDVLIGTAVGGALSLSDSTSILKVKGNWTKNTNGSFSYGSASNPGTVQFYSNGSISINNGTVSFGNLKFTGSGVYNIATAALDVRGSITLSNGTFVPPTGTLTLGGNFVRTSGIYNVIGTVNFNGTVSQAITNGSFNNVLLSGTNTRITNGALAIAGTTSMTAGSFVASLGSVITMNGNVTFASGTTFNDGGSTHIFNGGTWSSPGITTLGIGRVRFNAGNQTINASNLTGVILAGTGTKTIAGNVSLTGELNVSDNITLNLQTFQVQNTGSGIVMTVGNNSVVNVSGANNFPSGFGVYDIKCSATVNYNSSVLNQTIASVDYGHLTVTGGAPTFTKLLNGGISVCGNLVIAANTTLDVTPSNFNITIAGNFLNNAANGSFLARQGQVLFSGTNAQSVNIGVSGLSGNKAFYEFRQNKPSGTVSFASTGTVRINSHLTVLGGNLSLNGPDTVYVGGDVRVTGAIVNNTYNLTLKAETPGAYVLLTSGSVLSNVRINSAGSTYTLQDNLSIGRNLDLRAGSLVVGDKVLTLGDGNLRTANIYDKVTVDAGGTVALANNMTFNVNTTGSFDLIGVPGKIATVTSSAPGSRYNFNVDGRIKASNYLFEYMRASGVSLSATSIIAPYPNNFSDGTFANGTSGGVYLKIENTQDVSVIDTIRNVGFANNPGGGARNVAKTVAASGKLIFHNAIGAFAGENYENDPYTLVFWTGNYTLNWIGAVNTDWYNPLNWSPALVPTANDNAIIQVASNQPTIRDVKTGGLPGICRNLIINLGAELSLNSTDAKRDLVVTSDITINGVLKLNNANDTVYVGGNWQRGVSGSVPAGNGTVVLYASSGVKTVNNRSSSFGNLILNGAASFQLGSSTVISKSLNIRTGTLDVTNSNNYSLKVGGNWVNNGVFQSRGGTVTLNGTCASTYTFDPGVSGRFNSLIIAACTTSVYNLSANNLFVNNTFTHTSGVFNVNSLQVNVGDGIGSDALDISGTFNMNEFSNLKMGASSAISVLSGGVFKMKGIDSSKVASVSLQNTGSYSFVVNSGASISASFYSVSGLTAAGLVLRSGATVDPLNNLSNGDFSGGAPSGTYITFQNNYSSAPAVCDTIRKVTFASGPSKNATRITGTGCVAFKDAAGSLAGYLFEKDELTANANAGLLRWAYTNPILFWTGNAKNNDWFDYNNWEDASGVMGGRIPDNRTIVEIPTDPKVVPDNFPEIRANNVLCATVCGDTAFARNITIFRRKSNTDTTNNLRVRDGLKLIVNGMFNNTGGRITVAANSGSRIIVARDFTVADNATPAVGGIFNAGNATMDVYGSWLVSGTFNGGTSTVNMLSAGGNVQFTNRGGSLNNLNFNGPSTFQLPSAAPDTMKVAKNVTIASGATLTNLRTSRVFVVGGNWTNNGTFNHGSGKVAFNSALTTQIIDGSSPIAFFALDMYGAGNKQLAKNMAVAGNFTIGGSSAAMATTFDMNGKDVTMNGSAFDIQFTSTKIRHGGAGTFTFSSPSNQTVSISGLAAVPPADKAFFNVVKAGAGTLTMNTAIDIDGNLNINAGFLNSGNKQINIAGNWTNAAFFTHGSGTVVFDGGNQNIARVGGESFGNFGMGSTSRVTLQNTVIVNGALSLGGGVIIASATNTFTVSTPNLTVTRTTGFVQGNYRKIVSGSAPVVFEVGANGSYTPLSITPVSAASGVLNVSAVDKDSPNILSSCFDTSKTVNRYWTIQKSIVPNINITFNYSPSVTNVGTTPSTFGLASYNGTAWTAIPVVASPTATSLTANNVALTGEFQIGQYANTTLAIASNAPSNVICTGTNVTFTATPSFNAVQWKLNNANVGTATPTYTSSTLVNGDQIKLTTTAACITPTTSNTITMVVNTNNNWTGLVDNNWSRPSNWGCGLVPNSTRDAVIANVAPNAFPVISDTTNAIAANLTINSSAMLTIARIGKLQVYGNWSNAGNFVPNTGTVEFTGTAPQTITKSSSGNLAKFYNLTVNKTSGTVTVGATTNVDIIAGGTLLVSSGTFNLNSRTVTLKSWTPYASGIHKVDSTARLGRVNGTISNSTNFAIERYIPTPIETNGRAYTKVRYVSSPLQTVAASQWADSISIYGGSGTYAFKTLTGWNPAQSTLQSYYEPSTLGNVSRGFRPVVDNRTNMSVGQGYSLTVGFDGNIAYSKYGVARPYVILKSKGIPTVGDFSQALSKSGADPYGWNLVGNPYPSEIDWDLVWAANQTTVSSTVSQFDPQGGVTSGQYYYYNARTGKTVDPRYSVDSSVGSARLNKSLIASSQGFFVFARNQGSSNILFKETHKPLMASKVVSSYRVGDAIATVNIGVSNGAVHDNTLIYLDNSANTYGYDADLDAFKSTNTSLNVFTSSFGKDFAMNGISPEDGVDVPVSVTASAKGTYRITVRLEDGDLISTRLYLKDNVTGTLTELTSASQSFTLEVLTNGSTVKRFSIVSGGGNVVTGTPESVSSTASGIAVYPNPVTGDKLNIQMSKGNGTARQIEIMDLNGVLVYKTETQNMSSSFAVQGLSEVLSSGVYTVRVVSEDGVKQQKFVYLK